jgi:PmbA protein
MQKDDLLAVAERAVERARGRLGVEGVEAYATCDRELGGHIEKNSVSMVQAGESSGLALRVLSKGRLGFSYVTDPEDVVFGIDAAVEAAKMSKKLPFDFARPKKAPTVAGIFDKRIDALQTDALITRAAELIAGVHGIRKDLNAAGGGVSAGVSRCAISNSEGLGVAMQETGFTAACYVVQDRDGVSTGSASRSSTRLDVKAPAVGKEAASLAVAAANPKPLTGSRVMPVLVKPDAAADLVSTITLGSLSGRTAHRQESYYSGKLGDVVASSKFSLVEDPTVPKGLGSSPFDDEGVPSRPVRLISRGVLKSFLYDLSTAAEYEKASTSSAVRSGGLDGRSFKAPPQISSRQVRLEAPSRATERIIGSIDDGILVHDMMGVHTANVVSGDFGVTASVLFRIRKGQVEEALSPCSVSGNLHKSLGRGILMGDDVEPVDAGAGFMLPSLLFSDFTVTP